jgi:hypothetical protein
MKKIVLTITCLLLLAAPAMARESVVSLGYSLAATPSGALVLTVSTDTVDFGPWLGVSLYPPGQEGNNQAARHLAFPVKQGRWIKEIGVEPHYRNGTFEIAIWGQRIPRERCAEDDLFCQEQGFRLEGMYSYVWGFLSVP